MPHTQRPQGAGSFLSFLARRKSAKKIRYGGAGEPAERLSWDLPFWKEIAITLMRAIAWVLILVAFGVAVGIVVYSVRNAPDILRRRAAAWAAQEQAQAEKREQPKSAASKAAVEQYVQAAILTATTQQDLGWRDLSHRCSELVVKEPGWYLVPVNEGRLRGYASLPMPLFAISERTPVRCCGRDGRQFEHGIYFESRESGRVARQAQPGHGPFFVLYRPPVIEPGSVLDLYGPKRPEPQPAPVTLDLLLEPAPELPAIQFALERDFREPGAADVCLLPRLLQEQEGQEGTKVWYEVSVFFLPPLAADGSRRLPRSRHPPANSFLPLGDKLDVPRLTTEELRRHPVSVRLYNRDTQQEVFDTSKGGDDAFFYDTDSIQKKFGTEASRVGLSVMTELPCTVQVAIAVWYAPPAAQAAQ